LEKGRQRKEKEFLMQSLFSYHQIMEVLSDFLYPV